jgi:FixJ family two-component response regulator
MVARAPFGHAADCGQREGTSSEDDFSRLRRSMDDVTAERPLVVVVDDDESVRESLPDLLRELGFDSEAFASAEEFLAVDPTARADCLILDVSMPGMSGPELQGEFARLGVELPIIFITAHADDTVRPTLLEQGAVECLFKPFTETALLQAIQAALGSR